MPAGLGLRAREASGVPRSTPVRRPKLKGSIGEGPNHSNFSDRSSVKILAKIGVDTAENEQHFAEILPKFYKNLWTVPGPLEAAALAVLHAPRAGAADLAGCEVRGRRPVRVRVPDINRISNLVRSGM